MNKALPIILCTLLLISCGGGGGGGSSSPVTPTPIVNLSAEPTSVLLSNTSTLTWSSTNASSCSANWTSSTATSGSEAVTISTAGNNSFSITCSGAGGDRSASTIVEGYRETDGVVVDGYISGAEVFIDEDDDWILDSNENSTTSDNDGKFTIRYADGNLVSIGGTDLDSQTLLDNLLITHKLTGHSDFKAVTPVTSVAAFMTDASLVNAALGIDASIDVFTFDPVVNKGDGGINDYLYEKGNQLTVLAFSLQNISNDLNTTTETTQDYFKAITEEIEKEYTETGTKVDIETEAFITNVIENVLETKSVAIDELAKINTVKALSGILPVIEVKSSDDLTTAVIRFALSTLQTDIQAIANGSASAETITSYIEDILTYIAEDQNVDSGKIAPDITAIDDAASTSEDTEVEINVLLNDSYLTSAPITVNAGNGGNGTVSVASNIVTYNPDANYNGTDTISYTIIQGDKTSSADVLLTINPVQDDPVINIASSISTPENVLSVATISISDVDDDELTLTLSGTDADAFNLSSLNELSFKELPDYEDKQQYALTLSLTDGNTTVTKDITIFVTNVNDVTPVITSLATFSAAENQTAIGSVEASDAEGDDLTYAVSGSEISISSEGVLSFITSPDYESKTTYSASVTVSDGVNSVSQDITVNITNVNDVAPVISSSATFGSAENQTSIGSISASDVEGDDLTYNISGNEITISSSGVLTFIIAPDYESKTVYTATVTVSDGELSDTQDITVNITNVNDVAPVISSGATFSAAENQTAIGSVLASDAEGDDLTYAISGNEISISSAGVLSFIAAPDYESKSSYSATVTVDDGVNSTSQDITINITNVNDVEPVISSSATFSAAENQTSIGSVSASDAEGDDLTYSVTGSEISINSSGVLSFVSAPDYESKTSYTSTVNVSDGVNSATQNITVNITNVNDVAPVISSSATFSAAENQKAIGTVEATDVEGDDLTYAVSGSEMSISSSGILSFVSAPDYESKTVYSATITVSDGELSDTQNITVNISNLNDNSPIISSGSGFSVNENVVSIGQITVTDADGDPLVYSISGSEIEISSVGALSFVDANGADFETQSSYIAVVTVTDGIFSSQQSIIVTVNDINDNTPVLSTTSLTPNENLVTLGTVTATDGDANSTLSFTISGDDTLKDGLQFLDIDSSSGVITVSSGRGVLDYETKPSYSIDVTVSDGLNSSTETLTISVQNILEDFIDHSFSISDGTLSAAPVLTVNATIDELTQAQKVYVDLQSISVTPITLNNGAFEQTIYPSCSGSIGIYEMTKNDSNSWSLNQTLSSELSDLCEYGVNFYINLHDTDSESAPPTDGIHLQSGNKRLHDNTSQYSMFYQPNPGYDSDDLITISNPRADSTRDTTNGQIGVLMDPYNDLLYIWSPTESYPEDCSTDSYTLTITDELGIEETIITPVIAEFGVQCFVAVMQNQSSDPNKVEFNLGLYSVEPFGSALYTHIISPLKQLPLGSTTGNGGVTSTEVLAKYGTINSTDRRKATLSYEFDKAFLPEVYDSSPNRLGHIAGLYIEAVDESGIITKNFEYRFLPDFAGSDADSTAPKIDTVAISDYSNANYPQRNYKKFEVDFINDASSGGALTSIKDIWLSIRGGSECRTEVIYVRDELDGKISTDSTSATVTRPFLKQNEGTYIIESMNINDHGYAESYYGNTGDDIHPVIGTTFTVGDGSAASCPIFTQNYGTGAISVDVDENTKTIGTFAATGSSSDTIVYSIANTFTASNGVSIYDLVEIDSVTGALSYLSSPDYEGDTSYSGGVMVVATSTLNPNITDNLAVTVNIQNLNDNAPVFSSSSTFTADENQIAIGCVSVTDADAVAAIPESGECARPTGVTFTVSGDNLEISSDGRLSFTSAPDYETKSSYSGTVTASDGDFSTNQNITVNINDLNDNDPIVTSNTTFTVSENQTGVGQITVSDGDFNSSFTFTIVSDYEDGALFKVDTDGVITFKANANHETAGQYIIKVNISDGANTIAQIFTINLTDVCEFDFNDVVYSGLLLENYKSSLRPLAKDTSNSKFFYEFNIDTTDDACNVPSDEIYSFSLTGDDASAFVLESSTGNDTDKNFIYLNKIFDHETPTDLNSDNVYNVTLNVTLDDFTESKNLSLTVSDAYEFGEIQSYTFDESASKFTINFQTYDIPPNTSKLRFSIRGPSFTTSANYLTQTIDYDSGNSNYSIELDAASKVQELNPEDPTIYGGYYSVYKIEALDAEDNLVLDDSNADIVNSNIQGPRHLYYERSDGQNFTKLESISGDLVFDESTNSVIFSVTANTSNNDFQISGNSTNYTDLNVRLEASNDVKRVRGYGTYHAYGNSSQAPDENGDSFYTVYMSPNLRSGNHKYRIRIRDRAANSRYFYTYIYWSELQTLGYVNNPISYTNPNGTDDLEGPRLKAINSQPKDNGMTCTWYPDSAGGLGGFVEIQNIKSQIQFTDDSMSSADGQTATDADANLRYYIFDTNGNTVDSVRLNDNVNTDSVVDGNTKTFVLEDSSENLYIDDTNDSAQFILKPYSLDLTDAAGNRTLYTDGDLFIDVRYPSVISIYEDIDLRDYCNFNLGNNAPIFDTPTAFTINEGETAITTISATDADGDSMTYGKGSAGDSSFFTVNASTGELTFSQAPDYETPNDSDSDNVYSVVVSATDGFNTSEHTISVTVSNVNDNTPQITSSGTYSIDEGSTANIGTVTATDADGDTISFSLSGDDADSVQINSSSGVLSFVPNSAGTAGSGDYETKDEYKVIVTASDGGTSASSQNVVISINNVYEGWSWIDQFNEVDEGVSGIYLYISTREGSITSFTYTIQEGTANDNYNIVTVDSDSISADSSICPARARPVSNYVGQCAFVSRKDGGVIDYEELLGIDNFTYCATDNLGNTNCRQKFITVNNLNDNDPIITSSSTFNNTENTTAVGTITATDADNDSLTYSLSAVTSSIGDVEKLQIDSSSGILTFKEASDFEDANSFTFFVTASDGTRSDTEQITVTVVDANDDPIFTSSTDDDGNLVFSADENQRSIGTVTATDQDGDSLTFTITDGSTEMQITSGGVLSFTQSELPNYETRSVYGGSNDSTGAGFVVTVSDGQTTSENNIVVNINNLNDNSPVITSSASFTADENQTAIGTVVATDADGDTLIFSSSDTNIPINSSSGVLSFATAPDYEMQSTYTVTITVSDGNPGATGTNSTTQEITITIIDLDDVSSTCVYDQDDYNTCNFE